MRRVSLVLAGLTLSATIAPADAGHRAWVCSATPSVMVSRDSCLLPVGCPDGPYRCLWFGSVETEGIGLVRGRLRTSNGLVRAQCGTFLFQCTDHGTFWLEPGESDVFECTVSGIAVYVRIACSVGVAGHETI